MAIYFKILLEVCLYICILCKVDQLFGCRVKEPQTIYYSCGVLFVKLSKLLFTQGKTYILAKGCLKKKMCYQKITYCQDLTLMY